MWWKKAKREWLTVYCREGNRDKPLGEYSVLDGEVASIILYVKPKHEGNLECVAKGQSNPHIKPTVSNTHHLRVIGGSLWCFYIYDPYVLKLLCTDLFLNAH